MFVAGIDAHATYSVIAIVSNTGQLVAGPIRIKNTQEDRLNDLLQQYQPLEVVVETSPAWPWLFDRLHSRWINISSALGNEFIGLEPIGPALWQVYFGPITLGWFDAELFVIFDTHGNTGRNPIC